MDSGQLLLFVAAGLLLNLTPGPDVLYIVTHALRSGRRAGLVAALGITAGCFVHIVAAALGVSALLAASGTAFAALKWLGAAYLVYVGLRMLLARPTAVAPRTEPAIDSEADRAHPDWASGRKSLFFQGFWTNVLNPKVALFFLAFVPQFIAPEIENKALAFLLLGLLFNFNGLWVNVGWAVLAARLRKLGQGRQAAAGRFVWIERVAGAMFIAFGVRLALADNP